MEDEAEELARTVGEIISDVTQSGQDVKVGYSSQVAIMLTLQC